jgi:hypothetical protein
MSNWLEEKYIGLISSRLPLFKKKSNNLYNFRCVQCNDSKRKKSLCRAYFIEKKDHWFYYCHNCGFSATFYDFLKLTDSELLKQYNIEYFNEKDEDKKKYYDENPNLAFKKPVFITSTQLKVLYKISSLPADHFAKQYVVNRGIPNHFHCKLFYAPKFFTWVNTIIPDKFKLNGSDEPRLVIPFLDKEQKLFGFQGRSFDKDAPVRYYTIMLDQSKPKIFGLDILDFSKKIYIIEGPIDSMFIPNSIAMAGSDLTIFERDIVIDPMNCVMVFDNEKRSKEIVHKMEKVITKGFAVCIWPKSVESKDINDMVMSGIKQEEIIGIINTNTYSGLEAKLKLSEWKKC